MIRSTLQNCVWSEVYRLMIALFWAVVGSPRRLLVFCRGDSVRDELVLIGILIFGLFIVDTLAMLTSLVASF